MRAELPYRELYINRSNNRLYKISFLDLHSPHPRSRYFFPVTATFKFRAKNDYVDITRDGVYDSDTGIISLSFVPSDTSSVPKDMRVPYEMDAFFDGERHTVLRGHLVITHIKGFND